MSSTLYELGGQLAALDELLAEVGGDVTDEQAAEAINAWFAEIGEQVEHKLDGYGALIVELEARATARKAEADRMAGRAQVDTNAAKRLKERLKMFFIERNYKVIETPRFRVTLAGHGGKVPLDIDPVDAATLPLRFQAVSISPHTELIRAALEAGEALDFARLGERGSSIRIK